MSPQITNGFNTIKKVIIEEKKALSNDALNVLKESIVSKEGSLTNTLRNSMAFTTSLDGNFTDVTANLKELGIRDVQVKDNKIFILSSKGAVFHIISPIKMLDNAAKLFVLGEMKDNAGFFGIPAFINLVHKYRRFDIIKKGLGLGSTELYSIDNDKKEAAIRALSNKLEKYVCAKDLFANSKEVFYVDYAKDTVHSVRLTDSKIRDIDLSKCKFIKDEKGNIIGYEKTQYDIHREGMLTKKYMEKQTPSYNIPDPIEVEEDKKFAQACRFGNHPMSDRYLDGVLNIQQQLKKSGIEIDKNDLKIVRYLKGGQRNTVISCYSPKNGNALIFDREGKYMGKMILFKDEEGEVINHSFLKS